MTNFNPSLELHEVSAQSSVYAQMVKTEEEQIVQTTQETKPAHKARRRNKIRHIGDLQVQHLGKTDQSKTSNKIPPLPPFPNKPPYNDPIVQALIKQVMEKEWNEIMALYQKIKHAVLSHGGLGYQLGYAVTLLTSASMQVQQFKTTAIAQLQNMQGLLVSDTSTMNSIFNTMQGNSTDQRETGLYYHYINGNFEEDAKNAAKSYTNIFYGNPAYSVSVVGPNGQVTQDHPSDLQLYQASQAIQQFQWPAGGSESSSGAWGYDPANDYVVQSLNAFQSNMSQTNVVPSTNSKNVVPYSGPATYNFDQDMKAYYESGFTDTTAAFHVEEDFQGAAWSYAYAGDTANNGNNNTQSSTPLASLSTDTSNVQQATSSQLQQFNTDATQAITQVQSMDSTAQQLIQNTNQELTALVNNQVR